jgi:hypothetical protein
MGKVTFFKVWKELVEFGIVQQTRKYGKARLLKNRKLFLRKLELDLKRILNIKL